MSVKAETFCIECGLSAHTSKKRNWVKCSQCSRLSHCSCVGLTKSLADALPGWKCQECHSGERPLTEPISQLPPNEETGTQNLILPKNPRTIKRIPKGARNVVAGSLAKILTDCALKNDVLSWSTLFNFTGETLRIDNDDHFNKNLTTIIKNQVRKFCLGTDRLPTAAAT